MLSYIQRTAHSCLSTFFATSVILLLTTQVSDLPFPIIGRLPSFFHVHHNIVKLLCIVDHGVIAAALLTCIVPPRSLSPVLEPFHLPVRWLFIVGEIGSGKKDPKESSVARLVGPLPLCLLLLSLVVYWLFRRADVVGL